MCRKVLASTIALVLAFSLLLTGCGQKSLLNLLLTLLQEQYTNITFQADPELEQILRQAASENHTLEDMTDDLDQTLGKTIKFARLPSAGSGDHTYDLVFKTGSDVNAIARQTYLEWNNVFGVLPSGGQYTADLAILDADNGHYILISVTVTKGGSSGSSSDDDGDDENEDDNTPVVTLDYEKTSYGYLVYTNKGLQKVLFNKEITTEDTDLDAARENGFDGCTIKLKEPTGNPYCINECFKEFKGTLTSESEKVVVEIARGGLTHTLAKDAEVSNIDFTVTGTIAGTVNKSYNEFFNMNSAYYYAGALADKNYGRISSCNITFQGGSINLNPSLSVDYTDMYIGGIAGICYDGAASIENCIVNDGNIQVTLNVSPQPTHSLVMIGGITSRFSPDNIAASGPVGSMKECIFKDGTIHVEVGPTYNFDSINTDGVFIGGLVSYYQDIGCVTNSSAENNSITVSYQGKNYSIDNTQDPNQIVTDDHYAVIGIGNKYGY